MGDDGRRWRASNGEWRAGEPPEGWVRGEGGRWYPPPQGARRAGGIVLTWRSSALDRAEAAKGESMVLPGPSPAYRPPARPTTLLANRGPIRLHAVTRRRRRWSPATTALVAAGLLLGTSAAVALTASGDGSRTRASTLQADPAIPASPRAEPSAPPPVSSAGAPAPSAPAAPPPAPAVEPAPLATDALVSAAPLATAEPGSAAPGPPTPCGTAAAAAATVAPDGPRPGDGDGNPGCR